jgi:glucosyl-3-phosphoglycerate synthase
MWHTIVTQPTKERKALGSLPMGVRVSVVIPARDEAATVAGVVRAAVEAADEVVVVNDGSTDDTAGAARAAGARVVSTPPQGKGRAMRAGLAASSGDLVVFADADVTSFDSRFVTGLVEPLARDEIVFVKGYYHRPGEGGRVNELVARPMLRLLFPELASIRQPLGGEYAGRRSVLEALAFEPGYGVDVGLLIDVASRHGAAAIAQADLGVRVHRNRPLASLAPTAQEVMEAMLDRAGVLTPLSQRRLA